MYEYMRMCVSNWVSVYKSIEEWMRVCFGRVIMFIYMKYMSKEAEKNKHSVREKSGCYGIR